MMEYLIIHFREILTPDPHYVKLNMVDTVHKEEYLTMVILIFKYRYLLIMKFQDTLSCFVRSINFLLYYHYKVNS
jgi:hypothetical protein